MVTEVKPGCLDDDHDNIDEYGGKLIVGGQHSILNYREREGKISKGA